VRLIVEAIPGKKVSDTLAQKTIWVKTQDFLKEITKVKGLVCGSR
jgi:hypothetical protein